jgi:hypothetical protein
MLKHEPKAARPDAPTAIGARSKKGLRLPFLIADDVVEQLQQHGDLDERITQLTFEPLKSFFPS